MSDKRGSFFGMCPKILYGAGCIAQVPDHIKGLGAGKVLVVTDGMIEKFGQLDQLRGALDSASLAYEIYAGVNSEPTNIHVDEGLKILKESNCDGVIGIGGGSPMDAAKAIAIMATNPRTIRDYEGRNVHLPNDKLPLACITTTAGTSSEVSNSTIILDVDRTTKMLIKGEKIRADIAVCDPELTLSMPPAITMATGLDALAHAIEGFLSKQSQPLTDVFAQDAISLIYKNLPIAWREPGNIEARSNVMMGQLIAGMVMGNSSTASMHGMARPLGAHFHIGHGLSIAIFMADVMEFTLPAAPAKFKLIARSFGVDVAGMTDMEAGACAVEKIKELTRELKVPTLRELGVDRERFMALLPDMLEDVSAANTHKVNPRVPTREELVELYSKAINR